MLTFADDHGGIERSAKQLKAQAFPYDSIDCEPLLQELLRVGLVIEYEAAGRKYLHIKGFRIHQKVEKPGKPRVPLYEDSPNPPRMVAEESPTPLDGVESSRVESKGEEGKKPRSARRRSPQTPLPDGFTLDEGLTQYAVSRLPQVDVGELFEGFCGKARAKSWVYADWRQAWQEFCRNAAPDSGHWSSGQYPKLKVNGAAPGMEAVRW